MRYPEHHDAPQLPGADLQVTVEQHPYPVIPLPLRAPPPPPFSQSAMYFNLRPLYLRIQVTTFFILCCGSTEMLSALFNWMALTQSIERLSHLNLTEWNTPLSDIPTSTAEWPKIMAYGLLPCIAANSLANLLALDIPGSVFRLLVPQRVSKTLRRTRNNSLYPKLYWGFLATFITSCIAFSSTTPTALHTLLPDVSVITLATLSACTIAANTIYYYTTYHGYLEQTAQLVSSFVRAPSNTLLAENTTSPWVTVSRNIQQYPTLALLTAETWAVLALYRAMLGGFFMSIATHLFTNNEASITTATLVGGISCALSALITQGTAAANRFFPAELEVYPTETWQQERLPWKRMGSLALSLTVTRALPITLLIMSVLPPHQQFTYGPIAAAIGLAWIAPLLHGHFKRERLRQYAETHAVAPPLPEAEPATEMLYKQWADIHTSATLLWHINFITRYLASVMRFLLFVASVTHLAEDFFELPLSALQVLAFSFFIIAYVDNQSQFMAERAKRATKNICAHLQLTDKAADRHTLLQMGGLGIFSAPECYNRSLLSEQPGPRYV